MAVDRSMAGPLTLGAAPETLPHSSEFHQSQISFKHKGDGRGFFSVMRGSVPHRVCILYAAPSVFMFPQSQAYFARLTDATLISFNFIFATILNSLFVKA